MSAFNHAWYSRLLSDLFPSLCLTDLFKKSRNIECVTKSSCKGLIFFYDSLEVQIGAKTIGFSLF